MFYDHTDSEQSYYSMDTHFKMAKEYLKNHPDLLGDSDVETIEVPHGETVAELSWSSTLDVNDIKRKYYLLIHEFDRLATDIIPSWIPIPSGPPTNSELIIWLASVVDTMQVVLANLAVSGTAGISDNTIELHSISTKSILDDEDRFYDQRNHEFDDITTLPLVCSSYRDCVLFMSCGPTLPISPPRNWPLVCGDCYVGSCHIIPSDTPFTVLQCNKCNRTTPYHDRADVKTVNVRLPCKLHEMVYMVVYSNNHPADEYQLTQRLEQLHRRMQTNINVFEDGDMYGNLFYYSERHLVRQHRSFHELVACINRLRHAMIALGFNYKTRAELECKDCNQPPTYYTYVQPGPCIYHYCSVDSKFMKEIDGTRGIGPKHIYYEPAYEYPISDSDCPFTCVCNKRYSKDKHDDHECTVREDYDRFYDLYYNVVGRFKRVKRAAPTLEAEGAPELKKQKKD